jgi:hypothetical protein
MADLVVIVPTRGRPEAARELAAAFAETCTADTQLVFAVDDNDGSLSAYSSAMCDGYGAVAEIGQPKNMVHALNWAALGVVQLHRPPPFAVGFMGDDHRPRTNGWDSRYLEALKELGTGIVYGDDLLQSRILPTQCAMTADIVRALGFMAPPSLHHMYVDNFWRDLGQQAGCLKYLPDVVVEHLHPVANKADWDDGYKRVNAPSVFARDEQAYAAFRRDQMLDAVAKVRALRPDQNSSADVVRLRPAYSPEELAGIYATPHQHSRWADHRVRVAVTAQFAHLMTGHVQRAADLSCGDGTILRALDAEERFFGDYAPGFALTGAIDETIDQIPHVDLFVCCETLEHLDDPALTLRKVRAKTSTLVLSTPVDAFGDTNPEHYWAWSRRGVETLLSAAGFEVAVYNELDFRPSGCEYSFGVWFCR